MTRTWRSEERFRTAADALMDPFFIFGPVRDGQGKIVELEYRYVNQAALQLYQMPLQDIIGHGLLELFPSGRENGIWDTYLEPIETGVPARVDLPFFHDHGVKGRFEVSLTPFDEGLIISARDVTEARQAQEALQASDDRFRTSVEALQDGFAIFSAVRDSAGAIADFRYEYFNRGRGKDGFAVPGRHARAHPRGAAPRVRDLGTAGRVCPGGGDRRTTQPGRH